jgi:peptide/nickel transport system permease protein
MRSLHSQRAGKPAVQTAQTGQQLVEQVFADFMAVDDARPDWLVEPTTGRSHVVDRLYPELGIAIRFNEGPMATRRDMTSRDGSLRKLCRQAGVSLVVMDAQGDVSRRALDEIYAALSATARRVAQQKGAPAVKLDLLPRIASAKATCQQYIQSVEQVAKSRPKHRIGRWQRWQRRFRASRRRFITDWRIFAENRLAVLGLILIFLFFLMSLAHPILRTTVWRHNRYDPVTGYDMEVAHPSAPSRLHLLGTDALGRDVLSMLLAATTPTFIVGISAALTTALIGTAIGIVSAYLRGAVDTIFTHISDAFLLLPAPLFMVIVGMRFREIGPVPLGLIYGGIAGAGGAAIVMRSQAMQVVVKPFIDAARIAGGGSRRVMFVHVLPHMLPLAALYMMLAVIGAVVADAFIAFFGFTRSFLNWGTIIYSSFAYSSYLQAGVEWHVLVPPSIALSLFAAAFYFVARGLQEVADPRLRAR